jgi:hypothetical protein
MLTEVMDYRLQHFNTGKNKTAVMMIPTWNMARVLMMVQNATGNARG